MIKQLSNTTFNQIKKMIKAWDTFFFAPKDLFNVSLFRFLFGLAILGLYLTRNREFSLFFTDHGILPVQYAIDAIPDPFKPLLPLFAKTDQGIQIQGLAHILLIVGFTLGMFGRSLTWLLFLVNLGLNQRNMSIVYGADLFTNFWLFYLSFVDHNRFLSVWNYFSPKRRLAGLKNPMSDAVSSMGIRLLQIQMCMTYAYTGLEKLKGMNWWEGTAVWYVVGMDDLVPHDFTFLQHYPAIIALMSMSTLIYEMYFIFAVWNKNLRYPWLIVGFLFHLGTAIFMDLWFFFFVMTTPFILFLPDVRKMLGALAAKVRDSRQPAH